MIGYTESQLRFHQSDTYTRLGLLQSAWAAQERGLQICPPADYTDWALIRLDRATCLARSGDMASAITYATETLTHISAAQRQGIIAERGHGLLRTLLAKCRTTTPAREIQELLSADGAAKEAPDP